MTPSLRLFAELSVHDRTRLRYAVVEGLFGLAGAEPQAYETGRMKPTTFVGLNVDKRMTSVAIAESGCSEVRFLDETQAPGRRSIGWSSG